MRLFSDLYVPQASSLRDDPRMRNRLGRLVPVVNDRAGIDLFSPMIARLGITPSWSGNYWLNFYQGAELRDVLDSITINYHSFKNRQLNREALAWLGGVQEIFSQQNSSYRLDADGTVHFREDAAMEALSISVVATLNLPRYANVARHLTVGLQHLDHTPIEFAAAIRGVFLATEELFKTMYAAPRLTGQFVDQYLRPAVSGLAANNPPAAKAAGSTVESFKDWVQACHNYRHAEGEPNPQDPPHWLAISMVTEGINFVRWLASIDAAAQQEAYPED